MPDIWVELVLLGLVLEMSGALVLTIEAIGLERVRHWAEVARKERFPESFQGRTFNPRLYVPLVGSLMVIMVVVMMTLLTFIESQFHLSHGLSLTVAIVIGIMYAPFFLYLFFVLVAIVAGALQRGVQVTEARMAGVVGAGLLLAGFVLQFIGVLGAYVASH